MERVSKIHDVGIETYVVKSIHVRSGDSVQKGDLLIVIESSKVTIEVVADHSGVAFDVLVHEGDLVKSGNAVVRLQQDYVAVSREPVVALLRQGDVYGSMAG